MSIATIIKKLNSTKQGALFRHFCVSKVITTAHAHKSLQGDHHWSWACAQKWCQFSFFPRAFKQNKTIKALRPKMTKIASRAPALEESISTKLLEIEEEFRRKIVQDEKHYPGNSVDTRLICTLRFAGVLSIYAPINCMPQGTPPPIQEMVGIWPRWGGGGQMYPKSPPGDKRNGQTAPPCTRGDHSADWRRSMAPGTPVTHLVVKFPKAKRSNPPWGGACNWWVHCQLKQPSPFLFPASFILFFNGSSKVGLRGR